MKFYKIFPYHFISLNLVAKPRIWLLDKAVPSGTNNNNERTVVLYGIDNIINTELQCFSNAKEKIDSCMNNTRSQLAIEIEQITKAFVDATSRGVKLRYLTEITAGNISFCKELMSIVDEIRHLDRISCTPNFVEISTP